MKLILVGPGSAGKSTLLTVLSKKFAPCLSVVTRPMRPGEENGKDYVFITVDHFLILKNAGRFVQAEEQRPGEWYGTLYSDLEEKDVFIVTPSGLANLRLKVPDFVNKALIVYLNPNPEVILGRLSSRNNNNENAAERMNRDEKTFTNFFDWDLQLKDWSLPETKLQVFTKRLIEEYNRDKGRSLSTNDADFYDDAGMDSLDFIEYLMDIESKYHISIHDDSSENMRKFSDLAEYILDNLPNLVVK